MSYRLVLTLVVLFFYDSTLAQISLSVQTGHSASINKLAFSADGSLLASASSDNIVVIWNISAGKQLMSLAGHEGKVNDLVFHPTQPLIATASDDGSVIIWDYIQGEKKSEYTFGKEVKAVAFSPEGDKLAICGAGIDVINLLTEEKTTLSYKPRQYFNSVSFSNRGDLISFGGRYERKVFVVSVADGKLVTAFNLKTNQLVFTDDDRSLAGAGIKGKLRKWNVQKSLFSTLTITANRIWQSYHCIAVSEKYFAGGNKNNLISVHAKQSDLSARPF